MPAQPTVTDVRGWAQELDAGGERLRGCDGDGETDAADAHDDAAARRTQHRAIEPRDHALQPRFDR